MSYDEWINAVGVRVREIHAGFGSQWGVSENAQIA